jgi:8-oxo-dGTP pyrophosphatase MutT (NUDIX family)
MLAMKKRGFGAGNFNGVGGKVEPSETVEQAMLRETREEIGIIPINYWRIGENDFIYDLGNGESKRMYTHIYFCDRWEGEPAESEEMAPQWFSTDTIPFDKMWPDDQYWLPEVLAGNKVLGTFTFDEQNNMLTHDVKIAQKLPNA